MQQPQASGRHGGRFGIYNALLRDPDGYLVELQEFCEADEHARFVGRRGFAWLGVGQLWGLGLCSRYLVATDDAFDGITPCAVHGAECLWAVAVPVGLDGDCTSKIVPTRRLT